MKIYRKSLYKEAMNYKLDKQALESNKHSLYDQDASKINSTI